MQVTTDDLEGADRIVALKQAEHLPLLQERFPAWAEKVEFWHVDDAPEVLGLIEQEVMGLVARILGGGDRQESQPTEATPRNGPQRRSRPRSPSPLKVGRETAGRRGKGVTTVFDLPLDDDGLRELAALLKQRCGTGARSRTGGSRFRATSGNASSPSWRSWATRSSESGAEMDRCPWAKTDLYVHYHDTEWGVPVHDDRLLFEFLILEGAQAGLSWETILNKRESYRAAFDHFDPATVAKYGQKKRKNLLADAGIVRNRLKIEAAIQNAQMFLAVQEEFGTFDEYIWGFVGSEPKQNAWKSIKEVPAKTPESDAMSKDLKRRGFKFVGSTICYAFMQAVGMVNDHLVECFRHTQLSRPARRPK